MATNLSVGEKSLYWGTAAVVGVVTGSMVFIFGAVPAYFAGRAVKRRLQKKKALDESVADILERWNEHLFATKGLTARLAVPKKAMEGENSMRVQPVKYHCQRRAMKTRASRRFRLIVQSE